MPDHVASCSKNKQKNNSKQPGRITGEGNIENWQVPDEAQMGQIEEVELKNEMCSFGGLLREGEFELASVTDIPVKAAFEIRGYMMEVKSCTACGKKHSGTDRGKSYNANELLGVKQQKCLAISAKFDRCGANKNGQVQMVFLRIKIVVGFG
ncbi:MAG: hypothetical protein JNK77_15905 [Saprospiraceae bacterium]|nr:hypothetical protein [Saprospiraceae bacterium]